MNDYLTLNRANWDERAPAHAVSADYGLERYLQDPSYLSNVVRFDQPRLGDVTGLRGVHLQCHLGTDTISLARLGANMTGLDFSPASLAHARQLAERTNTDATFVESDVYGAADVLGAESFDLVYTGIGALCWLPSIRQWAHVVADLLHPGGRLFVREHHPVFWALADARDDQLLVLDHSYFEQADPHVRNKSGTYVDTEIPVRASITYKWNHGMGEIVTALLDAGLELTMLVEHDSVPWQALPGQMIQSDDGEWRLTERPWRAPMSFTLQARKSI